MVYNWSRIGPPSAYYLTTVCLTQQQQLACLTWLEVQEGA